MNDGKKEASAVQLLESGEMYLETILILSRKGGKVRSVDVCEYMGFSKPSVSRAVGLLKKGGFVEVSPEGYLSLTETGLARAEIIFDRHNTLTKLLIGLGVDPETASEDACKIEHDISDRSFSAIKAHMGEADGKTTD